MKKITTFAAVALTLTSIAQNEHEHNHEFYGPENPIKCANNIERDLAFEKDPSLRIQDSIAQAEFQSFYEHYYEHEYDPNARSTYVIPVVVHICHLGGEDNISDEQVYDAIDKLNEDFSMTNPDVSTTLAPFDAIVGNADIEFRLATKDPNGNCHTGITRTYTPNTVHDGDGDLVDDVQAEHGNWPQNRYMNIFVCQDPAGAAGYTNNPSVWYNPNGMDGSIYMRHDYMGTIGTGSMTAEHTLSHEVGHWLNLSHCWGGNNNPGQSGACSDDDGVADTPRTIGWTYCDSDGNTCTNDAVDGYWTTDVIDNVQNIMEYSYCSTMFTQGQVGRMHAALNSGVADRDNLWTASNLAFTGTDGPGELCEVKFSSSTRAVCVGQAVEFFDESYHNVTSRTWTFDGASPASSSAESPTVVYNTPGVYPVTLQVSDGTSTISDTQTDYIVVFADPGSALPHHEGFETISVLPDNQNWMVLDGSGDNVAWEHTNVYGSSGSTNSAVLNNYGVTNGSIDELISKSIDLSTVNPNDPMLLTFEYAYRQLDPSNIEKLRVYISKDCGETWALRKNIQGSSLSDVQASGPYTPFSELDWYYVEVDNINSDYYVSDFRYKFQFTNDGGNNIYIDNINLYPVSMTSLAENDASAGLKVYPNPTDGWTKIEVTAQADEEYNITLHSAVGQQIQTIHSGKLQDGKNSFELNTAELATGIYLVKVASTAGVQTIKLVVE